MKTMKVRVVDKCGDGKPSRILLQGAAVSTDHCSAPVGVQLEIIGYDQTGALIAARDGPAASISNAPLGDCAFSLDRRLDYDPGMKKADLVPIGIRQ